MPRCCDEANNELVEKICDDLRVLLFDEEQINTIEIWHIQKKYTKVISDTTPKRPF
jgi:hypothetical protein